MVAKKHFTVGDISRRLGETQTKIRYIAKSRGIQHDFVCGLIRVYNEQAVKKIETELKKMADWRASIKHEAR